MQQLWTRLLIIFCRTHLCLQERISLHHFTRLEHSGQGIFDYSVHSLYSRDALLCVIYDNMSYIHFYLMSKHLHDLGDLNQ